MDQVEAKFLVQPPRDMICAAVPATQCHVPEKIVDLTQLPFPRGDRNATNVKPEIAPWVWRYWRISSANSRCSQITQVSKCFAEWISTLPPDAGLGSAHGLHA